MTAEISVVQHLHLHPGHMCFLQQMWHWNQPHHHFGLLKSLSHCLEDYKRDSLRDVMGWLLFWYDLKNASWITSIRNRKILRIKLVNREGMNLPWVPYELSCDICNCFLTFTPACTGAFARRSSSPLSFRWSFFVMLVIPLGPLCFPWLSPVNFQCCA